MAVEAIPPTQERIWSFFQGTRPRGLVAESTFSALSKSAIEGAREEFIANEFSLFVDRHAQEAADLATELMDDAQAFQRSLAVELSAEADESEAVAAMVERAVEACERLRDVNPELAEAVLMMFLTHQRSAQAYAIPPLAVRAPYKVLPSRASEGAATGSATKFGSTPPEDRLDWFREDPLFNEHHEHWHIVYPFAGIRRQTRDRQGEMFLYMHQQMLARYEAERLAVGLPRTEPFDDFSRPMEGGYHPGPFIGASFSYNAPRPPGLVVGDLKREMYGFPATYVWPVSLHRENQRRLEEAVRTGYLRTPQGAQLKLDANSLGHTMEASNIDNVNAPYYGTFHNNGHRFIAAAHDPDGSKKQPLGVMARPETSFRDPIFFRWHKALDDLCVTWQETQPPNDFSDGPQVRIRSGLDAQDRLWSPDILLCERDRVEALREAGLTMEAIAQGAFGGPNWRNDYSAGEAKWRDPANGPEHRLPTVDTIRTFMARDRIIYDGKPYEYDYLNHRPVTYFLRLENRHPEPRDVTIRIFLVPEGFERDRRMYIEMDKFRWRLDARERRHNVVWRHDEQSSIIRKPAIADPGAYNRNYDPSFGKWLPAPTAIYLEGAADWAERRRRLLDYHDKALAFRKLRFGEEGDFDAIEAQLRLARRRLEAEASETSETSETTFRTMLDDYFDRLTDFNFDRSYCSCGYPYSLLFPRGTPGGMKFRFWVLVTDWEKDRVEETSRCASMSFCGAKDRYPDMRAMGYPFDRPFSESVETVLGRLPNAAGRRLMVRQEI